MKTILRMSLCVLLSVFMVFGNIAFALPVLDLAESADELVQSGYQQKASTQSLSIIPGLNILTQSSKAWTSEPEDGQTSISGKMILSYSGNIADNPKKSGVNTSSKVLKMSTTNNSETYPNISISLAKSVEGERKIYSSFKRYKTYTPAASESPAAHNALWVLKSGNIAHTFGYFTYGGDWKTEAALVDFSNAVIPGTSNTAPGPFSQFSIQSGIAANVGTTDIYYDDLLFIPEYKISYMMNDGTDEAAFVDYVLFEDDDITKPMLTSYTIDDTLVPDAPAGHTFMGWSVNPNSETPDTEKIIALKNQDIVLYAVWNKEAVAEYKWDFETKASMTWNDKYDVEYKNGMMILDTASGDTYIDHKIITDAKTLSTDSLKYLVVNARSRGNVSNIKFKFRTTYTDTKYAGGFDNAAAVDVAIEPQCKVFKEYCIDLTKIADWEGDYINCMLELSGNGVVEIEDIYLTSWYVPKAEDEIEVIEDYHYDLSSIKDGTFVSNNDGTYTYTSNPNGVFFLPATNADAAYSKYLVLKTVGTPTVPEIRVYWNTTDDGGTGLAENKAFNISPVSYGNTSYYIADFSSIADFKGTVEQMMLVGMNSGTAVFSDIYLTNEFIVSGDYIWNFEGNTAPGVAAWSGHTSYTLQNGKMVISRSDSGSSGGISFAPQVTLSAKNYPFMAIKAAKGSNLSFVTYFVTGEMTSIGGSEWAASVKLDSNDANYEYYYFDFAEKSGYSVGNIKNYVLVVNEVGTHYIEEIWLTDDLTDFGVAKKPSDGVEDDNISSGNLGVDCGKKIEKVYLNMSEEQITTDRGTINLIPYVRFIDGSEATNFAGTAYITDSVCAQVTTNSDGTAVVTGQIDGTVTITAMFEDGSSSSQKIVVSGQQGRVAANSFKVMMYGNSIRAHAYAEGIGWLWTHGMAASKEENDYAHRFVHYMEKKYGEGTVDLIPSITIAGLEGAISDSVSDYSSTLAPYFDEIRKNQPDIVTIQMGENGGGYSANTYEIATGQLVAGIKAIVPDAIVIVCTPFWGGAEDIEGMTRTSKTYNVPLALVHTLGTDRNNMAWDENGAFMTSPNVSAGVRNHPGDIGMDKIAQLLFEKANILLSANEKTVYAEFPESIQFTSNKTLISDYKGTLQLEAKVYPADAAQDVIWSVDNPMIGTVDSNGLVTARNNGTLTVTVASRYLSEVKATVEIEITGQPEPHTVTYDKNTTDTVTNMPEPNHLANEIFTFDKVYPVRSTYKFLGWSLTPDGEVVESTEVVEDITVYAIWEKAVSWSFDTPDYKENFTITDGFNQYVRDGYFTSIATDTDIEGGKVLTVRSPELDIDPSVYPYFSIRLKNTIINDDTAVDLKIMTQNNTYEYSLPITSTTDFVDYDFDISDITETITGFEFVPVNIDCTIYIEEIAFCKDITILYDPNTSDTVANMPEFTYLPKISLNVPTRQGYTFLGWSLDPSSKLLVDEQSVDPDDITALFAIWDKNDHWEFDDDKLISVVGGVDESKTKYEDGKLYFTSTGLDPTISLYGKDYGYPVSSTSGKLEIREKWDVTAGASTYAPSTYNFTQVFFMTDLNPNISERGSAVLRDYMDTVVTDGFIKKNITFTSDIWTGNLNTLRFDLLAMPGDVVLDYIRFTNSEANIVTQNGSTRILDCDDWATHIVRTGGTIAPQGVVEIKNLYLTGDIDMSKGYMKVTNKLEIAPETEYATFTLTNSKYNYKDYEYMYISGCSVPVEMVEGQRYIVKTYNGKGFVYFGRDGDASGIAVHEINKNGTSTACNALNIKTLDTYSVRTKTPVSVRVKSFVSSAARNATIQKDGYEVEEYGYIASTGMIIGSSESLTLSKVQEGKAVKGISYDGKNGVTDIIFAELEDGSGIEMSAIFKGIPATKQAYMTNLYLRTYMKLVGGNVIYGNTMIKSLYDLATEIKADMPDDAPYASYINGILEICK